MHRESSFSEAFAALTGHGPFPWQEAMYARFIGKSAGRIPQVASIPTGLGKTSVIAVWLLALMKPPNKMPRRLVYVVNRRTVVDQTTAEVNNYRQHVLALNKDHPLRVMIERLGISTLRGQFADNQEWSADPSRPAVICGTVDMIGSRLLFEGYRIGFKSRPLHAGFLGQDALLVHDEAHLEPAFQALVTEIEREQQRERDRDGGLPWPKLQVMALSATARSNTESADIFGLKKDDFAHKVVKQRIKARKALQLHPCNNENNELIDEVVRLALAHKDAHKSVVIYLQHVNGALAVYRRLEKEVPERIKPLTGTMRGLERDELVTTSVFQRYLHGAAPGETVYLVCTSAGEVGVNLSADHMVCDLSTLDSMAQRFGRVNRFGDRDDTHIDVVHPTAFDDTKPNPQRKVTLELLKDLNGDASPKALSDLRQRNDLPYKIEDAFAPEPTILPATDILFDAWAMTTIRGKMPGRPPVAPYLHGVAEWEPPRTSVAWREDVEKIADELILREGMGFAQELLADYPLKPHELLSDRTDRIYETLEALIAAPKKGVTGERRRVALERAYNNATANIWLIDDSGMINVTTLGALIENDKRRVLERLADGIILLPPCVGGLSDGMLNADSQYADDVSDRWLDENGVPRRRRVWNNDPPPTYVDAHGNTRSMALVRTVDINPDAEESESGDVDDGSPGRRFWHWYVRPREAEDATRASAKPITWDHHTCDVVEKAKQIVNDLELPEDLRKAVIIAAELHDLGKKREQWQRSIGNPDPTYWHSKSGRPGTPFKNCDMGKRWQRGFQCDYRHEFGSLLDVLDVSQECHAKLDQLSPHMQDVVLHLIAAHHGRARPHFSPTEIIDPQPRAVDAAAESVEVVRRYARLQRKFGRWGLAYLESLLRAADWAASANPSVAEDGREP